MTMDQFYLAITLLVVGVVLLRARTALHSPLARPTWFATVAAIPAILSRGAIVPIETLDAWLGGSNVIFLIQCWATTLAFWGLAEAAGLDPRQPVRLWSRLWIPLVWCVVFTIPFFLIPNRTPTELFFIDAHVQSLAAVVCGVLYMSGIVTIAIRLIWTIRRRAAWAYWVFRMGATLMITGSVLWVVAIMLEHTLSLARESILWMYLGFDVLFYPGVVALALGFMLFAALRSIRQRMLKKLIGELQAILANHSIESVGVTEVSPFGMFDLLVQIEDMKNLGVLTPSHEEQRTIERATAWTERTFPQVHEIRPTESAIDS